MFDRVVLVLGPHRTGTSLLSAAVEALGHELGERESWHNDENPKGFFENGGIVAFNDRLLAALGGRWDNPLFFGCAAIDELATDEREHWVEQALQVLRTAFPADSRAIAIKDPRFCLLLPFWHTVLARAGVADNAIHHLYCLRNPLEMAASQQRRHQCDPLFHVLGKDIRQSVVLWFSYMAQAIQFPRSRNNLVVCYESIVDAPLTQLSRLRDFLSVTPRQETLDAFAEGFVDRSLHRCRVEDLPLTDLRKEMPRVHELYARLLVLAGDAPIPGERLRKTLRMDWSLDDIQVLQGLLAVSWTEACQGLLEAAELKRQLGGITTELETQLDANHSLIEQRDALQAEAERVLKTQHDANRSLIEQRDVLQAETDRLNDEYARSHSRHRTETRQLQDEIKHQQEQTRQREPEVQLLREQVQNLEARFRFPWSYVFRTVVYPLRFTGWMLSPDRGDYLRRELGQGEQAMSEVRTTLKWRFPQFYSNVTDPFLSALTSAPRTWHRRLNRNHLREQAGELDQAEEFEQDSKLDPMGRFHPSTLCSLDRPFKPRVTVLVPNYNHARYLIRRLDSIYDQTYTHLEVILMDDCSSDDSRDILRDYARRYPDRTRLLFNDSNSGTAFRQWARGIREAEGDLVWIAESDDFCDPDLLEKLVPFFRDEALMLSYARSTFVDEAGEPCSFRFEDYVGEVDPLKWSRAYVETAHREVNQALAVKNTIPNVSSVLFRRSALDPLLDDTSWMDFRNCGDWIVYLRCIRGGKIGFSADTSNYFRFHAENTSKATHGKASYYREHEQVAREIVRLYDVPMPTIAHNRTFVERFFRANGGDLAASGIDFDTLFDLQKVSAASTERLPNVLVGCFAFSTGGGEVVAMRLAEALKQAGFGVTFFDYEGESLNRELRQSLSDAVPLVQRSRVSNPAKELFADFGVEIVNSHHACVDEYFALAKEPLVRPPRQVVTMHGMYEAMPARDFRRVWTCHARLVDHWIYIADKNLEPFERDDHFDPTRFTKLINGKLRPEIQTIQRDALSVPQGSFLVSLASRAIPEKGWEEAVQIIERARHLADQDIHLLLIGNGPVHDQLKADGVPSFVHLLGFQSDVPSLFAIGDVGLLPTRFKGESFPLVVIECFMAGRPMVATDIGETRAMIAPPDAEPAGYCFPLKDGAVDIEGMAHAIASLAGQTELHRRNCRAAEDLASRFEMPNVIEGYREVFLRELASDGSATVDAQHDA